MLFLVMAFSRRLSKAFGNVTVLPFESSTLKYPGLPDAVPSTATACTMCIACVLVGTCLAAAFEPELAAGMTGLCADRHARHDEG